MRDLWIPLDASRVASRSGPGRSVGELIATGGPLGSVWLSGNTKVSAAPRCGSGRAAAPARAAATPTDECAGLL